MFTMREPFHQIMTSLPTPRERVEEDIGRSNMFTSTHHSRGGPHAGSEWWLCSLDDPSGLGLNTIDLGQTLAVCAHLAKTLYVATTVVLRCQLTGPVKTA